MSEGLSPVQIVIGRNTVDGYPLSADAWGRFRAAVIGALAGTGEFFEMHPGLGVDIKGGVEVNAKIDGSWPDGAEMLLEDILKTLRVDFEQATILLIWGELEMIT